MENQEIKEIIISALVLALAFGILFGGGVAGIFSGAFAGFFIISIIAISLGFILHELGHRQVARHFGAYAEFKMWAHGLILALVLSLTGLIVFAAPGAVVIHPRADLWGNVKMLTRKMAGLISIAGPALNVLLAFIFYAMNFFSPTFSEVWMLASQINIWLALFNMIPFPPLDGSKIFSWDKRIWGAFFAILIILFIFL